MGHWRQTVPFEREVMEQLWLSPDPPTVRQLHATLSTRRDVAYTTLLAVLQRLTNKQLVVQRRDARHCRYAPARDRGELVAELMVGALRRGADPADRRAAFLRLVDLVGPEKADELLRVLAEVPVNQAS